jgi:tRNA uridine 5-carbamoylmethylation protein Kti12
MRRVIALRGIPGSGKSTVALDLCREGDAIVSADDYFNTPKGYVFDPSKIGEAHATCFKRFLTCLAEDVEVIIVDNTNLSAWELSPYAAGAAAYGYSFEIVSVSCDPALAFKRQTHGVPAEAHKRMAEAFAKGDVLPWWKNTKI